jgi:hypothetical protein
LDGPPLVEKLAEQSESSDLADESTTDQLPAEATPKAVQVNDGALSGVVDGDSVGPTADEEASVGGESDEVVKLERPLSDGETASAEEGGHLVMKIVAEVQE